MKFADEYIANGGNTTKAYLSAYKNVSNYMTAAAAGSRLLKNVKVADYIAKRTAKILKEKEADGDEVIVRLTSIARREPQEAYSKQYDHLNNKVIKEITYTFQPSIEEAQKALETLVKWLGLDNPLLDIQRKKLLADTKKSEAEAKKAVAELKELVKGAPEDDGFIEALKGEVDDTWQ